MDCFIKQLKDNDCAFASLKMLLAYYSKNKEYLYLKQDLDVEDYSLWDVIQIAKRYGVEIQGVKVKNLTDTLSLDFQPFLALLKEENSNISRIILCCAHKHNLFIFIKTKFCRNIVAKR